MDKARKGWFLMSGKERSQPYITQQHKGFVALTALKNTLTSKEQTLILSEQVAQHPLPRKPA
eukprot:5210469-Amphidinium_carterae.1